MLFQSLDYLCFFAIALVVFWALLRGLGEVAGEKASLVFIFVASCLFYMAWHPTYIVLILSSILLDYFVGQRIHRATLQRAKKNWLLVSLIGNLGLLGAFKYFNFFMSAVSDTAHLLGIGWAAPHLNVLLPVGISFYTFQTMSYSIDLYRGRIEPAGSLLKFAVFVTYFPQLVAGPIVRASEFLPQLEEKRTLDRERVSTGLFLIITGLVKKLAIADYVGVNLVDRIFENPSYYTASEVIIALYGFTLQIYCDFSGYTDVARGSARLMGIELPENFDRPYQAKNPAEFWRRWHMTLSTWLRDYLYFPLGGSRVSPARAYFNLGLTMFLIGIWHGASWTFVIYALLQSAAMVSHRFVFRMRGRGKDAVDGPIVTALKVLACLQFVVFSRILFRATSIDNAWEVTAQLGSGMWSMAQVSTGLWVALIVGFAMHYTPRTWYELLERRFVNLGAPGKGLALATVGAGLALVSTSELVPFIYYQF